MSPKTKEISKISKKTRPSKVQSSAASLGKASPQTMAQLLSQTGYQIKALKRGDLVEGVITRLSPKEILIDIDSKSEGTVSTRELANFTDLWKNFTAGDRVTAYVVIPEDQNGQIVLSLRQAALGLQWQKLKESKDRNESLEVHVLEANRGGLIAEWEGLRGFIPISQLESSYLNKPHELINKNVQVKVLDVDSQNKRLIFSQKRVKGRTTQEALEKIKVGQTCEGVVTGVFPFGIFVDIEGAEGLVHISEISWEKSGDLKLIFSLGDKVKVKVLGQDKESQRLTLSLKQLTPDPWQKISEKYPVGKKLKGQVTRITNFGVFVRIDDVFDGLLHLSKIPPERELKEGEKLDCLVDSVDLEKRRISLNLILKKKPIGYK